MTNVSVRNGWESLPNGFDVEFRHSIPVRISELHSNSAGLPGVT